MGAKKLVRPEKNENALKVVYRSSEVRQNKVGDYYPFGMAQEGSWQNDVNNPDPLGIPAASEANDKFKYNGLESEDDLTGWIFYKFRAYDPSIGRFISADPIADKFAHLSPNNNASNNPIKNIDLWGLQGLFAVDGTLTGYKPQQGQGSSQIAQDLNENYSCYMTCDVQYTDLIQDNAEVFDNVMNDDGSIVDKSSDTHRSGNVTPEDILSITDGIEGGQFAEEKSEIDNGLKNARVDSATASETYEWYKTNIDGLDGAVKDPGDDWIGGTMGKENGKYQFRKTLNISKNEHKKKLNEANRKIDSLNNEKQKYD